MHAIYHDLHILLLNIEKKELITVYTKFAGHAGQTQPKPKMSGKGLLLNSIKCPAKRSKCPAKLKKRCVHCL